MTNRELAEKIGNIVVDVHDGVTRSRLDEVVNETEKLLDAHRPDWITHRPPKDGEGRNIPDGKHPVVMVQDNDGNPWIIGLPFVREGWGKKYFAWMPLPERYESPVQRCPEGHEVRVDDISVINPGKNKYRAMCLYGEELIWVHKTIGYFLAETEARDAFFRAFGGERGEK